MLFIKDWNPLYFFNAQNKTWILNKPDGSNWLSQRWWNYSKLRKTCIGHVRLSSWLSHVVLSQKTGWLWQPGTSWSWKMIQSENRADIWQDLLAKALKENMLLSFWALLKAAQIWNSSCLSSLKIKFLWTQKLFWSLFRKALMWTF